MKTPKHFFRHHCLLLCAGLVVISTGRGEALLAYSHGEAIYTARAADGQGAKRVCAGNDPCISNDGRFLAYTRTDHAPAKAKHRASDDSAAPRVIILRDLASGKETPLPSGGAQQVYGALWSPDDAWIACNVLTGKNWQVAVVHPDGSGFRVISEKLDSKSEGYFLAGWNLHDKAVLVENLNTLAQLDPATGGVAWQRPVKGLTGEESCDSGLRCMISADGKLLVSTRSVDDDEFTNLDGPSAYLVLTDFPDGKPRRVTPKKFDAAMPWLDATGTTIYLRGFGERDVQTVKGTDGVKLKTRIYRYDVPSGKLTPLVEGGETPSVSRG